MGMPATNDGIFKLSVSLDEGQWIEAGEGDKNKIVFFHNTLHHLRKFPRAATRPVLRAVTTFDWPFMIDRPDLLYASKMRCHGGLLCWIHRKDDDTDGVVKKPSCCAGFVIDLVRLLQDDLNVDLYIYDVEDKKYGAKVNDTWNGLIGDLLQDKADMIIAYLSITSLRSEVVDFSDPFLYGSVVIATLNQEYVLPFFNVEAFAPLSRDSWILIFGTTLLASVFLLIAERLVCKRHAKLTCDQSITYMMGLLFQRDIGGDNPHHHSSRTVAVVMAVGMMIIMTTYTAVLTARNITSRGNIPISGFRDPKVTF